MSSSFQANDSGLSANGRFSRLSYLGWSMLLALILCILGIIAAVLIPAFVNSSANFLVYIIGLFLIIIYITAVYFNFIFTIRRLHDRNQTGWLSLFMIVPLLNFLLFIYLSCAKGDENPNNYGSPRITQGWEKVMGWIYITLFQIAIVGILAAISIPAYQDYVQRSQQIQMEQHN